MGTPRVRAVSINPDLQDTRSMQLHNVIQRLVEKFLPPPRLQYFSARMVRRQSGLMSRCVGHGLGLGRLAQGGAGGLHLGFRFGRTPRVVVHQREGAHAGAGQGLGAPASHAAQTEHGHVGGSQALHGLGAQKHLCAESSRPCSSSLSKNRRTEQRSARLSHDVLTRRGT